MSKHNCNAFVATCIDFRLQKYIEDWLHKNVGVKEYDRVAWAGGVLDLDGVMKQLSISVRLHQVKKVILINHEDCGAYGEEGTLQKHKNDLLFAKRIIKEKFPKLIIVPLYLKLNGIMKDIS